MGKKSTLADNKEAQGNCQAEMLYSLHASSSKGQYRSGWVQPEMIRNKEKKGLHEGSQTSRVKES